MTTPHDGLRASGAAPLPADDDALTIELRLLCRGLAHSSLSHLTTVRTVVHSPNDEASERALRQTCGNLAAEFGLESGLDRTGDAWEVRFSRPTADERARQAVERARSGRKAALRASRARSWGTMRPGRPIWPGRWREA